jgi:hypothetical protein
VRALFLCFTLRRNRNDDSKFSFISSGFQSGWPTLTSLELAVSLLSQPSVPRAAAALPSRPPARKSFTREEDLLLAQLVAQHGASHWEQLSKFISGRTARQCRERWRTFLSPELINGPWSHAEDQLLDRLYAEHGSKWSVIAKHFRGRSDSNVKNRWNRHWQGLGIRSQSAPSPWDCEESVNLFSAEPVGNGLCSMEGFVNW